MFKNFLKCIMICITIYICLISIVKVLNLYINLNEDKIKIITFIISILTIVGLIMLLFSAKIWNFVILNKIIDSLTTILVILFMLLSGIVELKTSILGIERGSLEYDRMFTPVLYLFIPGILLAIYDFRNN